MTNELLIFSRQTCMWSVRTSLASRSTQSTTIIVWQCQRILRLAVAEHQKKTCMAAPSVARALRRRDAAGAAPRSVARARAKRTLAFRSSSYYWLPPCNFVQYTNSPSLQSVPPTLLLYLAVLCYVAQQEFWQSILFILLEIPNSRTEECQHQIATIQG